VSSSRTGPAAAPTGDWSADADQLYGRNAVAEALRAGRRRVRRATVARGAHGLESLVKQLEQRRLPIVFQDRARLDHLAQSEHHQGIVAEADPFPYSHLDDLLAPAESHPPLLVALDTVQDPRNFGTLLRTAQAVAATGVVIPEHRAVGITPAVVNTSSGAVEHLLVARVTNLPRALASVKERNVWVYGLAVEARRPFWEVDWTGSSMLVVGSEGAGLGRLVRETCDELVHIPMAPDAVESLNAAVAGSIVLYAAFRARSG